MLLVDANILMYAAGAEHPNRSRSLEFLNCVARGETEAAIDAEVLQEILHRYRALNRWVDGRSIYDHARTLFSIVLPITQVELDRARLMLDEYPALTARDALHAAVVESHGLDAICSFDRDFDQIATIRRVEPS